MYVPIKTANQHVTVYRIIGLPNRIGKNKFVLYQIDFPYFAIGSSQRDYALLTETELQQCTSGTVTVCLVSTAFYDIQTATCPLSLYFQTAGENKPCRRTILLNHDILILRRHDTTWIFHCPQPTQVSIRCPRNDRVGNTHKSPPQRRPYLQRHVMFHNVQQGPNTAGVNTASCTLDWATHPSTCLTNLQN